MREDIKSMTQEEIAQALAAMGEKPFRGRQIFAWPSARKLCWQAS